MNSPPINDKLKEGILGYRSSVRNWSKYNRSLVERMFSLLDANSLSKWKHSLEEENKCKRGRPFKVPDVLINFLAKLGPFIPYHSDLLNQSSEYSQVSWV